MLSVSGIAARFVTPLHVKLPEVGIARRALNATARYAIIAGVTITSFLPLIVFLRHFERQAPSWSEIRKIEAINAQFPTSDFEKVRRMPPAERQAAVEEQRRRFAEYMIGNNLPTHDLPFLEAYMRKQGQQNGGG